MNQVTAVKTIQARQFPVVQPITEGDRIHGIATLDGVGVRLPAEKMTGAGRGAQKQARKPPLHPTGHR